MKIIKETVEDAIKKLSKNRSTEHYVIPKRLKFPRELKKYEYFGMEVFESFGENQDSPILLYFHGGAYIDTFAFFHWNFIIEMAQKTGCGLVIPNYLMMPKWTAKASNEITIKFYEKFSKTHDMSKVIIGGDSSGGGLAVVVLQNAIKMNLKIPKKAFLLSPWVDVTGGNPKKSKIDNMIDYDCLLFYGKIWQKGYKNKDPFVSPLYGDFSYFPETDIWLDENEVLFDDIKTMYNKMIDKNIKVHLHYGNNEGHAFPLYSKNIGKKSREEIAKFIST